MRAETLETDVLIIGGGAAGCTAALHAHALGAKVLMAVKGKMGRSGATPLASRMVNPVNLPLPYGMLRALKSAYAAVNKVVPLPLPGHLADQLRVNLDYHGWLIDQDYLLDIALWIAKEFYPNFEANGTFALRDAAGRPVAPGRGADSYILHSHGLTGYLYGEAKRKDVLATDVGVMEEAMVLSLLQGPGGEIAGAMVLDYARGRLFEVVAKSTILATGHTNWLATRSTGTREMAANGLAMALRAGAELQNMEIQWYHSADMTYPKSWMRLHHFPNPIHGTPKMVAMVNKEGERYLDVGEVKAFMPYTHQLKAQYLQIRQGKADWEGGNFSDFRHIEPEISEKYQYGWEFYEKIGLNMARDLLPGAPTWHMTAGGVRADTRTMKTELPRLFIAGAIGGHSLGGVQLATYDGTIAGKAAARAALHASPPARVPAQVAAAEARLEALLSPPARTHNEPAVSPIEVKKRIRAIVGEHMMFVKTEQGLNAALEGLDRVRGEDLPRVRLRTDTLRFNTDLMDALDLEDMLQVGAVAAHAALARRESRGPHFREDYPFTDNDEWLKRVVVALEGGRITTRFEPAPQAYVRPERGRRGYFDEMPGAGEQP